MVLSGGEERDVWKNPGRSLSPLEAEPPEGKDLVFFMSKTGDTHSILPGGRDAYFF